MCGLFVAALLAGVVSTFELSGTVLDENGFGLPGATLTLVHEATAQVRSETSNDSGAYRFPALVPGVYSLEVSLAGYATPRYAGLRYFADTKPIFNVTLKSRAVQESMTFTGEAPLVNVSQSQVGQSVEEKELEELPLRRRDYLELVGLEGSTREIEEAPPAKTTFGAPLVSIDGASAHYTVYQLDSFVNTRDQHGVVKTDVSLEAIEEFRVVTGQFSAEYGGSPAGVVSAATKSGGNDFHGSLHAFVRPGSWDASDPLTGANTALDRQELGFNLGGPLRRDRTHFFASVDYRNETEDVVVTAPFDEGRFAGVFELPRDRLRLLFKVGHEIDPRNQLNVKVLFSDETSLEGVGGFDVFENGLDTTNEDVAVDGTLVSELGATVSELRLGFSSETFHASAGPPPLGPAIRHPLLGNIGTPTSLERADENHVEIAETLSFPAGRHSLVAGVRYLHIGSESELDRFSDGLLIYPPEEDAEPILFWQRAETAGAPSSLERDETHWNLFLQDDWQLSPYVTLNLGLRWTKETSVPDNDNFQPRLGIHWDATRDGRTSVRAGYGIYTGSVYSIVDSLERLYGPSGFGVVASSPGSPAAVRANYYVDALQYSPDERRSPYSQHATVGVERELAPSVSIAFDLSYVRGSDLILPSDVNAPTFFDYSSGGERTAAAADATRPYSFAPLPSESYRDLYLLASRGSSRFWGAKLAATKRYAASLSFQATYQWSRTTNDGDDFRIGESLPLDPSRADVEWGRSSYDVPHAFVASGAWDAPFGLRLTGIFRARSGRPIDPRLDRDVDGDLKLRERAVEGGRILDRNSFRAPSVATLDLSVSKTWEISEARRLELGLSAFNLTNRLNPLQVLASYGPSFLTVVQAGPPRQFQLSVRFLF
jgi:hypothetical protein